MQDKVSILFIHKYWIAFVETKIIFPQHWTHERNNNSSEKMPKVQDSILSGLHSEWDLVHTQ